MVLLFRIIAFLEGLSYILLLFVASPLKWFYQDDTYVKLLGMPHGILFILYLIFAFLIRPKFNWNNKSFLFILVAAIIPFGTFYVDYKFLKHTSQ